MKQLFKRLVITLPILFVLTVAALVLLVTTQSGLRVLSSFMPDSVSVGNIEGSLSNLSVERLMVTFDGGNFSAQNVQLKWSLVKSLSGSLSIDDLQLSSATLVLTQISEPSDELYQPWGGIALPIDVSIKQALLNDMSIIQNDETVFHLDKAQLVFKVVDNLLSVEQLSLYEQNSMLSLTGKADLLNVESGEVELQNSIDWVVGEERIIFDGKLSGSWKELRLLQAASSPVRAQVDVSLTNIHSDLIGWDAKFNTVEQIERADVVANLVVDSGQLSSKGTVSPSQGIEQFNVTLLGQLLFSYAHESTWLADLDVSFDGNELNVNTLNLEEQGDQKFGIVNLTGSVKDLVGFIDQSNKRGMAKLQGNWSKVVLPLGIENSNMISGGVFDLSGSSSDLEVNLAVDGVLSDSRISDTPFKSEVSMRIAQESVAIDEARLWSGKTNAYVKGKVDADYDLQWEINSPNLANLWPTITGDLISNGTVTGPRDKPQVKLVASSNEAQFNDIKIRGLSVAADASLINENSPLSAQISLKSITSQTQRVIENLKIDLTGTKAQHQLSITSNIEQNTAIDLQLSGAVKEDQAGLGWLGNLFKLDVNNPEFGNWGLSSDAQLSASSNGLSISSSCFKNAEQLVCIDANSRGDKQIAKLKIASLAFSPLNRFLAEYDVMLAGIADGEISYAKNNAANAAAIAGFLESSNGKLSWQVQDQDSAKTKELSISEMRFDLQQKTNMRLNGLIKLEDGSQLTANVESSAVIESTNFNLANIVGQVEVTIDELANLPPSLAADLPVKGKFDARLDLGGTIKKPEVSLSADVIDASLKIPELGLELNDIELSAKTNDESLIILKGKLMSGAQWLDIDGTVNLANLTQAEILLKLKGDGLTLADTSELAIVGGLDLEFLVNKQIISIKGSVNLESAELDFKVPESAVLVSDDVVLLGNVELEKPINKKIDLRINLGDKTHIVAQGLDAKLFGSLRVSQKPEGILRGDGQIDVLDGRYMAYGQDLEIDKGRIVFNGGSVEDPNIELKAQKTIDGITAGVRVSGRVSAPTLDLYSTPTMSDQDVLSVLVFNKPVDNLGSADGLALLQIANSLRGGGRSNVAKITQGIQNTLGLTDLELNLGSSAPSIQAGKQLSSKFYVGYGYSLLNAAQTIILRYALSDAWSINADVGADSGADVRYQIER